MTDTPRWDLTMQETGPPTTASLPSSAKPLRRGPPITLPPPTGRHHEDRSERCPPVELPPLGGRHREAP